MVLLTGFIVDIYVPLLTDSVPAGIVLKIIPVTGSILVPGELLAGKIAIWEALLYLALLAAWMVPLVWMTGKVYRNRLFRKGVKGIIGQIVAIVTGVREKQASSSAGETEQLSPAEKKKRFAELENTNNAGRAYSVVGLAILTFVLAGQGLGSYVANIMISMKAASEGTGMMEALNSDGFLYIINSVVVYCIAFPLCALVMKFAEKAKGPEKPEITRGQYARLFLLVFPVSTALALFSNYLAGILSGGKAENTVINNIATDGGIQAIVMTAVLAPIFEELVFRKMIIDRTVRYGEASAIIYSALAFGLFHCNLYQIFYTFGVGLIWGYVYVRTGKIWYTIAMHMAMNSLAAILAPISADIYNIVLYALVAAGVIINVITIMKRDLKLKKREEEVPSGFRFTVAAANTGTILFVLICSLMTVYQLVAS
jgi:membrane protease YdiL (CAAX protease family)